jgi:hypothetical protein
MDRLMITGSRIRSWSLRNVLPELFCVLNGTSCNLILQWVQPKNQSTAGLNFTFQCALYIRCTLDVHNGKEFTFESFRYPNCTFVLSLETRYIDLHLFDNRWPDMNQTPFIACFLDWHVHRAIDYDEWSMMASVVIHHNNSLVVRMTSDVGLSFPGVKH